MIIKGSNSPIICRFDSNEINVNDIELFEAVLYYDSKTVIKRWDLSKVTIMDNDFVLTLSQAETLALADKNIKFEMKLKRLNVLDIFFNEVVVLTVQDKFISTILGTDEKNISIDNATVINVDLYPKNIIVVNPNIVTVSIGKVKGNTEDIVFQNQDKILLEVINSENNIYNVRVVANEELEKYDSTSPSQVGPVPYSWFGLVIGNFKINEDDAVDIVGLNYNETYQFTEADALEANAVLPDEYLGIENKFFSLWLANDKPESMTDNKRVITLDNGIDKVEINIEFVPFA